MPKIRPNGTVAWPENHDSASGKDQWVTWTCSLGEAGSCGWAQATDYGVGTGTAHFCPAQTTTANSLATPDWIGGAFWALNGGSRSKTLRRVVTPVARIVFSSRWMWGRQSQSRASQHLTRHLTPSVPTLTEHRASISSTSTFRPWSTLPGRLPPDTSTRSSGGAKPGTQAAIHVGRPPARKSSTERATDANTSSCTSRRANDDTRVTCASKLFGIPKIFDDTRPRRIMWS